MNKKSLCDCEFKFCIFKFPYCGNVYVFMSFEYYVYPILNAKKRGKKTPVS